MIKSYTNLTNKSFFHELYYSLIILQYVVPCIYIYIVHWLDTLCLIQPIPFQAHRFYIEISLFSLSGIILNNRKLLNSSRNVFGVALRFVNSVSNTKSLNILPQQFILELQTLLEKPPAFSASIGNIFWRFGPFCLRIFATRCVSQVTSFQ